MDSCLILKIVPFPLAGDTSSIFSDIHFPSNMCELISFFCSSRVLYLLVDKLEFSLGDLSCDDLLVFSILTFSNNSLKRFHQGFQDE